MHIIPPVFNDPRLCVLGKVIFGLGLYLDRVVALMRDGPQEYCERKRRADSTCSDE